MNHDFCIHWSFTSLQIASQRLINYLIEAKKIDVTVHSINDFSSITPFVSTLSFANDCDFCNEENNTLKIAGFQHLAELKFGDNSFNNVLNVVIEDCFDLEKITFGVNCFNAFKNWKQLESSQLKQVFNPNKNLCIRNCMSLKYLLFNPGSFVDFAGSFELKSTLFIFLLK